MIRITDATKGFDFSPWGGIEGFLEASKKSSANNSITLKRAVPDLARAVDMTAVAISSLPFDIVDLKSGDVLDSSEDWQNKLGGIPNPQRLLYLLASSLCGGEAYLIPTRTPKMIYDLQYIAPHTVEPYITRDGLQWFDRTTDTGKVERFYPGGKNKMALIYFWLPDSDVELGPAENHPLGNAVMDAELILNMKNTMRVYGERGFVPITLLGAKGMPNEGERQKAERFFDRLLKGGFDVLAKIVNSEALSLIRVGAGMEELKGSYIEIKREATEGVFRAFGIPSALAMSDNAFASEFVQLRKTWYTASRFNVIYQTIEETLTDQLLKPYGYKMVFNLEALDMFQEDENERGNTLVQLVTAISANAEVADLCMDILGYDLTQEQADTLQNLITSGEAEKETQNQLELQKREMDNQERMEMMRLRWGQDAPVVVDEEDEKDKDDEEEEEPPAKALTADEIKDLALWADRALAWHRKGKGSAVDWENKHLPEEVAAPIRIKLANATSEEEIKAAFELGANWTPVPEYKSETIYLDAQVEAIKELARSIDAMVETEKAEGE